MTRLFLYITFGPVTCNPKSVFCWNVCDFCLIFRQTSVRLFLAKFTDRKCLYCYEGMLPLPRWSCVVRCLCFLSCALLLRSAAASLRQQAGLDRPESGLDCRVDQLWYRPRDGHVDYLDSTRSAQKGFTSLLTFEWDRLSRSSAVLNAVDTAER